MSNESGIGWCYCPMDRSHRVSFIYEMNFLRRDLLAAIDDHLDQQCPAFKQRMEQDYK